MMYRDNTKEKDTESKEENEKLFTDTKEISG